MRQTERQWGRRGGRKKKLNHYSQLTDRYTDGRDRQRGDERLEWTDTLLDVTRSRSWPARMSSTKKKKNTCRNEYWVETLHRFSFCPSVVHQVHHSGPVTCRQKPPGFTSSLIFGLDSSDFAFVTLANFSAVDGWCAPVLIYRGGCFPPPISPPHSFFIPAPDSFSSAWLSQLECLMAFKWQHLSQQTAVIGLCFKHR